MNRPVLATRLATRCLVSGLVILSGCGYSFGPGVDGQGSWPREVETVAVPIFDNQSFWQGLEFRLTEEFIEQLRLHAPVRVVPTSQADAVVDGAILHVRGRVRQEDRKDRIIASQVEVTAEVHVTFPSSGRRVGPLRLIGVGEYITFRGETMETGTEEALRLLARDLVMTLATMDAQDRALPAEREERLR